MRLNFLGSSKNPSFRSLTCSSCSNNINDKKTDKSFFVSCLFGLFFSIFLILIPCPKVSGQYQVRPPAEFIETGAIEGVECISNGKFYRNPEFKDGVRDCAKYYWCPRGKVLEFRCSAGLWFDVDRQICDFKSKIRNCEKSHGKKNCF